MNKCSIDGCDRPRRKREWCETHYSRFRAHGDPLIGAKAALPPICEVNGCDRKPIAKRKCRKHYYAAKRPTPKPRATKPKVPCAVDGCDQYAKVRGWCGAHYQRWRRFGDPTHMPDDIDVTCTIEGCNRVRNARGLCGAHYYRLQKFGDPEAKPIWISRQRVHYAPRICATCGREFDPGASAVRKYCGRKCARARRGGSVNRRSWVEILGERDSWACHICGQPVDRSLYWPNRWAGSVDHRLPVSKGGTDAVENLALAHLTCNCQRSDKPLPDDAAEDLEHPVRA